MLKKEICTSGADMHRKKYEERYFRKMLPLYQFNHVFIPWVGCTFSNALIPEWCFQVVGEFDENFKGWGFEDLEVTYRLWNKCKTYPIQFKIDKQLVNYHLFHTHHKNLIEQRTVNYKYFCEKHHDPAVLFYEQFSKNIIDIRQYNQIFSEQGSYKL
jgi:predicted glycosyltransferase involved in capsule biosynthesis